MQVKSGYLLRHVGYEMYLSRMANGLTKDLFAAIRFTIKEDAEQWMNGIYAPEDKEDFEIVEVEITIQVKEVMTNG